MKTNLENKVAIVTGGAAGIGQAICIVLAKAGAKVSVADINGPRADEVAGEICAAGGQAIAVQVDVTVRPSVENMLAQTEKQLGVPDILVNNAGVFYNASFDEMTEEQWGRMIEVNLTSVYRVSQVIIRCWLAAKMPGVIVNLSSMVNNMAFTNSSHYIASKSGVYGLTRAIAFEFAGRGIRANALAPGIIETDMSRPAMKDPDTLASWMSHIPLQRVGQPEDIAQAALFLASDASSYITGQLLTIDGGWLLE